MSQLFSLAKDDYIKGLVVAVLAAVFTWLAQAFNAPGFDLATFSWMEGVRIAVVAVFAYLAKNLATDNEGKVLGMGR
ncbi:MAG: hypothetical protein KBD24_04475 [Candidatus Pacebacteria bacterium]|nr:hypothetical protein [Candidatus Paceibacterota bacterium]